MTNMSIHDNSFMKYYNFLFTDLAGNFENFPNNKTNTCI